MPGRSRMRCWARCKVPLMIRFDRACKRYPNGREALSGASFEVAAGEMVFLTGRSGAGKSTILKLIALLERPTRGLVMVNGRNTAALSTRKIPAFRRELGMVFQDHRLLPERSVFDNVALPLHAAHVPLREIDKRVRAALDQVGLLDRAPVAATGTLGGRAAARGHCARRGRQAKAADRRRTHGQPRSGPVAGNHGCLKRFNEVGVTVVIATHDVDIVKSWGCARI